MDDLDLGATIKGFIPGQKMFGRYTLTKILGRGGMGIVWLARDEKLERDIALKFLPEVVAADPRAVDELKRETRRSLELTHPHIVRIYDFVEDARTAAIAMEYIPGATLAKLALDQPQRAYDAGALTAWVAQLCEALDYAHRKAKVVHRDLKPANLMIDGAGELKVADFGIAASVSDSVSRVSQQGGTSGTPVYMSPQQMMGEKPAVTDDIYALGATLYDLITGKPPFYTGNIILQVQSKVPPSVAARRTELGVTGEPIPPGWEATIAACLAKEAKDRPQSAGEVAERLGLTTKSTKSTKTGEKQRAAEDKAKPSADPSGQSKIGNQKPVRRSLGEGGSKIAAVAAIAVIAAAGWYFGLHAPEQRRIEAEQVRVEQARIETERQQAEVNRIAAEREAEARRIEAARLAAEQEAERQRLLDEQRRIDAEEREQAAQREIARIAAQGELEAAARTLLQAQDLWQKRLVSSSDWAQAVAYFESIWVKLARVESSLVDKGMALISAVPNQAAISLDSQTGTGTLLLLAIKVGEHEYTVELEGYTSERGRVLITPGRLATPATISLKKQPAQVTALANFPVAGQSWENSLGMKFVPVPGTNVLFSIWETREKDYAAFVRSTNKAWSSANAGLAHPAVNVSWNDAQAFCRWLTEQERGEGKIGPDQSYRLPTDAEWSLAVGLTNEPGGSPADKDMKVRRQYPWGPQWPPPRGAGNYDQSRKIDSFERTAPVGSFSANAYGLHDMGGNVWELVEDKWNASEDARVLRGASFARDDPEHLLSSFRYFSLPDRRTVDYGFRVVVALGSGRPHPAQATVDFNNPAEPTNLNKDVESQASLLRLMEQEFLPGVFVAKLDESLRRNHGLPQSEQNGLVVVSSTGRFAPALPVGTLLQEVNRVPVVDVDGAKNSLRPGRNLALLWVKGSNRRVMFEVDAASLQ
jgi:formylglycine-generating enzyme required for sulfatase activity